MRNRFIYLDYTMYIILIILLYILIVKMLNTQEGFEHKGKSFIADISKKDKVQQSDIIINMIIARYKFLLIVSNTLIKFPSKHLFGFGSHFQDIFLALVGYANAQILRGQTMIKNIFKKSGGGFIDFGNGIRGIPGSITRAIRENTRSIKNNL